MKKSAQLGAMLLACALLTGVAIGLIVIQPPKEMPETSAVSTTEPSTAEVSFEFTVTK